MANEINEIDQIIENRSGEGGGVARRWWRTITCADSADNLNGLCSHAGVAGDTRGVSTLNAVADDVNK